MALAIASFLPGFGYFIAALAVTWALLSDRPKALLAAAIAATGAIFNLVLTVLFLTAYTPRPNAADLAVEAARPARRDLVQLLFALERYRGTRGTYPASLSDLLAADTTHALRIRDLGAPPHPAIPYHYVLAPDGQSYDLFSVGADGIPGTPDDIRPPLPESLRNETGYAPYRRPGAATSPDR